MKKNNWYKRYQISKSKRSGSVILLALILTAILLSVGMGISEIAMKEIRLSSIGTESGLAFYAADAGVECALFWDIQRPFAVGSGYNKTNGTFATSSFSWAYNLTPNSGIRCPDSTFDIAANGDPAPQLGVPHTGNPPAPYWMVKVKAGPPYDYATTTFLMPYDYWTPSTPCAIVEVAKKSDRTTGVTINTTIDSHGRSSCDSNPRRVERGIHVAY